MSDYETAAGPFATRIVETLDAVEPELVTFVRTWARYLDARDLAEGTRGPKERGQWVDDDGITTYMQQVEDFDADGRGIRTIRLLRHEVEGGPNEGALRVIAIGLANDAKLELRWNVIVSPEEVRGTSAELTAEGAGREQCIAAFRDQFDVPTS
ncbi:MAG TPA: hypothetical protein VL326_14735 [Kofleriaceae bacterium]|jgi:hypothetical protein|nr:hypothetical protein [Kofleriaceae bacterium]